MKTRRRRLRFQKLGFKTQFLNNTEFYCAGIVPVFELVCPDEDRLMEDKVSMFYVGYIYFIHV